jgi:signal transduction histidine kinase
MGARLDQHPAVDLRAWHESAVPRPHRRARTQRPLGTADERRRLERDLHDGVQNQLVALIVRLGLAADNPATPPAISDILVDLQGRAQATLECVRNLAHGIYPRLLADLGIREALRAQAAGTDVNVTLHGSAPRSTEAVEEAVYFACSEALQNVAKHAGHGAAVELRLEHQRQTLVVRIADDGQGFDPARAVAGAGIRNIRDRISSVGGTFELRSKLGTGTVLTISVPWPPADTHR